MIKYPITYVDYNDEERTEELQFNLSKAELADLQLKTPGGFAEMLEEMVKTRDGHKLVELIQKVLLMSYGEKSPDGKTFNKSEELTNNFKNSAAYSELYMELLQDADKAAAFIKGVLPKLSPEEEKKAKEIAETKFGVRQTSQFAAIPNEAINTQGSGLR